MKDLVSVIVPVYKVEKYLDKCVKSIISQTYKNLEIILVDDGSPDVCGKMCDDYAKIDKRIKVIHKENGGLSSARNTGIDVCKGEYIAFADSDDWVEPKFIELMLEKQKQYDVDFVCCSVKDVIEKTGEEIPNIPVSEDKILEGNEIIAQYYQKYSTILTVAWNKLYKREIFKSLRYPLGRIYEDTAIILNVLNLCKKIVIVPDMLYNYLKRENSIMRAKISEQKINSIADNFSDRIEFLIENNYKQYLSQEITRRTCDFGWLYRTCGEKDTKKQIKSKFKPLWKKYKKYVKFNGKQWVKMKLNVLYMKLF